jgi:hypothetical protein
MNLVPTDSTLGPRIGPKIFADVPSAAELASAQAQVAGARRGRSIFLLITVLLLGALAAAVAFVFIDRDASQRKIGELTAANGKLTEEKNLGVQKAEGEAKRLLGENTKLTTYFGPYQAIAGQESQVTQLREQIRAKTDLPVYSSFRMTAAERKALDSSAAWPPATLSGISWKARVQENLALQVTQLEALQERVEKYTAPSGTGGEAANTCTDPRKTWPNC